jgi:hypothetical protein
MYREWKEIELCWFGDVQRMEGNRILKTVLNMNMELTRPEVDKEIDSKMK